MRYLKTYIILLRYKLRLMLRPSLVCYVKSLKILDSQITINRIVENRLSVVRFGDGEFYIMGGGSNGFQHADNKLSKKLKQIFRQTLDNILICIPMSLKKTKGMRLQSKDFAAGFLLNHVNRIVKPYVPTNLVYGDSLFTRFYMMKKSKKYDAEYIDSLKRIWADRNIVIVEGAGTRMGVGNDLLDNAKSIRRIICPNKNAFDKYDYIYNATINNANRSDLIMISLGITATVLAYDLSKEGFQAIDTGHIDIEYEWMKMGAKEKCVVNNKRMAEIKGGQCEIECSDSKYQSQIIVNIK